MTETEACIALNMVPNVGPVGCGGSWKPLERRRISSGRAPDN